jgi:hypothetical protein
VCLVRAAARLKALAHDDVNGLAQVAGRFPEDFLAVARADAVERFQDRLLDGIDLGDVDCCFRCATFRRCVGRAGEQHSKSSRGLQ